jgi:hypothetical protein
MLVMSGCNIFRTNTQHRLPLFSLCNTLNLEQEEDQHRLKITRAQLADNTSYPVATPKGNEITLTMSEIYSVEKEKIQGIRVYYDAEEFRKEFRN